MASYTKAKIFNMALKNLGVSVGVQGVDQNDRNTVVLNDYYDTAKEKVLMDHDWSFASTYRELTPTGNTSINPKYSNVYDYPNNCVFVREIVTADETQKIEFEIASLSNGKRVILTNESPATIRYTRLVDEETYYPPNFAMALAWFLAFLTASSVTGARAKTSDCMQIYRQMLLEARTTDANEGVKEIEEGCDWLDARD